MLIARTLTLASKNTGYSLYDLLVAASVPAGIIPNSRRVASLRIILDPDATGRLYFIENKTAVGGVANTADVPTTYGFVLDINSGSGALYTQFLEDIRQGTNTLSLDEIVVDTGTDGLIIHLWAYTI